MKRLGSRVNLIPVIAKADTMTPNDLLSFKQRVRSTLPFSYLFHLLICHTLNTQVREAIAAEGIRIYTPPIEHDDNQAAEHAKMLTVRQISEQARRGIYAD